MTKEQRSKAAKRAAQTRATNRYAEKYYHEVTEPAHRTLQAILMDLLQDRKIVLRWNPKGGARGRKLKHGVTQGVLVGFREGFYLRVLADGYRKPQDWHPAFWEFDSV